MNLESYMFPIERRSIAVLKPEQSIFDVENPTTCTFDKIHEAIIRPDTDEIISIVKPSYKIVTNEELIKSLLEDIEQSDIQYKVEDSHSYVENNRMRLQLTFPEYTIQDSDSDLELSLYIHNSYDGSEGVRLLWGFIRWVCTNGMIAGKEINQSYHRHTKNIDTIHIQSQLNSISDFMPKLKNRITKLENESIQDYQKEQIEKRLGKEIFEAVDANGTMSKWQAYNVITYIISHSIAQHLRTKYLMQTAKIFNI